MNNTIKEQEEQDPKNIKIIIGSDPNFDKIEGIKRVNLGKSESKGK